ncbi:ROK family transcriptional regulator [Oceanobacillus alkalisoli]|uniref:ROK family transcriptional regulator n=1 Tax=Oceanobacillus alkalisoli TaxID=2925113 RepID=UPI001EF0CC7D|nr:ROK family transcriptional regulator [Oceanobacillus alkalisoli]MCF3944126.1 ROK family transcriptional regulator [Oceanobacillus alkalisoli]MCG5102535.1 ROK family transcriptional regulator [Oceanobacillus alkalisoli]
MFNMRYDQKRIRKYHYFLLLSLIQKHKKMSRTELAKITNMSNTTVGKIIKELLEDGLVKEVGQVVGDLGRRATLLKINSEGAYIIGVEINLDHSEIAVVSLNGTIVKRRILNLNANQSPETVLNVIILETKEIISEMSTDLFDKILAIGVNLPGLITWPEGKVLVVPQFHWREVNIKEYIEKELNFVVYIDTDTRTELLAEHLYGGLTNYENAVCLYIGSGVGSAVMVNGELVRGHDNMLGEIGHITIDPNGDLCDCGRLGCLQTFFCSSSLEKKAQKPLREIFTAYELREDWAVRLINQARLYIGLAISNISCIYNPEAILITGPMVRQYPQITKDIEKIAENYVWAPLKTSYKLVKPSIEENSGVIGASAIVLKEFLRFSNDDI